ncbi:hypothetical protein C1H46_028679 [Malus baccata]|uniref:F-box domain-containing protein n=1 Tax=Malus baccata TaxID=106549 RepID=A0A540LH17_MALBA|nr:hypothetical protein C1H46_028679 [Malus baccata]
MASSADNIPHELLANIGNRLNTTRFRAVCFTVIESAVYHLAPPTDDDPQKRGWLINVKEVGPDRQRGEQQTHRAPHPLSCLFEGQPKSMPRDLTFEILKLEAHKKQWVKLEAQALDDQILVLGDDGWYSLSARDFPGVEGKLFIARVTSAMS